MVWRKPPPVTHNCHTIIVYYKLPIPLLRSFYVFQIIWQQVLIHIECIVRNHLTDWPSSSSDSEEWVIRVSRPAFGRRWLEASYSFPHQASPETHPAETNRHWLLRELCAHQREIVKCENDEEGDDRKGGQKGLSEPSSGSTDSRTHQRFLHGPQRGGTTGRHY